MDEMSTNITLHLHPSLHKDQRHLLKTMEIMKLLKNKYRFQIFRGKTLMTCCSFHISGPDASLKYWPAAKGTDKPKTGLTFRECSKQGTVLTAEKWCSKRIDIEQNTQQIPTTDCSTSYSAGNTSSTFFSFKLPQFTKVKNYPRSRQPVDSTRLQSAK